MWRNRRLIIKDTRDINPSYVTLLVPLLFAAVVVEAPPDVLLVPLWRPLEFGADVLELPDVIKMPELREDVRELVATVSGDVLLDDPTAD